jgi:hypothetical protein
MVLGACSLVITARAAIQPFGRQPKSDSSNNSGVCGAEQPIEPPRHRRPRERKRQTGNPSARRVAHRDRARDENDAEHCRRVTTPNAAPRDTAVRAQPRELRSRQLDLRAPLRPADGVRTSLQACPHPAFELVGGDQRHFAFIDFPSATCAFRRPQFLGFLFRQMLQAFQQPFGQPRTTRYGKIERFFFYEA